MPASGALFSSGGDVPHAIKPTFVPTLHGKRVDCGQSCENGKRGNGSRASTVAAFQRSSDGGSAPITDAYVARRRHRSWDYPYRCPIYMLIGGREIFTKLTALVTVTISRYFLAFPSAFTYTHLYYDAAEAWILMQHTARQALQPHGSWFALVYTGAIDD